MLLFYIITYILMFPDFFLPYTIFLIHIYGFFDFFVITNEVHFSS